jgi:hypothetical protein
VAMSESWIVIHVPFSNSGHAANTASNWN